MIRRSAALVFDAFTLAIGFVVLTVMIAGIAAVLKTKEDHIFWRSLVVSDSALTIVYIVVMPAFRGGVTFGKEFLRIHVAGRNGQPLDFAGSVVRNLDLVIVLLGLSGAVVTFDFALIENIGYAFIALAAFRLLDAVAVIFAPEHRGLRDLLAGTKVVKS